VAGRRVLGAVIIRLLKPKELVLARQQADLMHCGNRSSVLRMVLLCWKARSVPTYAVLLTADTIAQLSWWRKQVVKLWALACNHWCRFLP